MKKKTLLTLFKLAMAIGVQSAQAQTTAFTYQGKLTDDCCPANGFYQMRFKLCSTAGGAQVTGTPIIPHLVFVTNGLFTTNLNFGAGSQVFDGSDRWLEIEARTNSALASFVTLLPRTELTPTPYALYAQKAAMVPNGAITPAMINSSGASQNQVLTFNGSSIVWANSPGSIWSLNGANAYYNSGNVGIGTPSPEWSLDVRASQAVGRFISSGTINGAVIELRNDTPGADYLGAINFNDAAGSYAGQIGYHANGDMTFRSGGVEAMRISGSRNGVAGYSSSANDSGVYGQNNGQGAGIAGRTSGTGSAVYGDNADPNGWAGRFNGRVGADSILWGITAIGASLLSPDQGGSIELGHSLYTGTVPYIDFHYGIGANQDYNVRLINDADGQLTLHGNFRVNVLTITGGADLAEPFQMSSKNIPKGALVTIDEENAGQLKMSDRAYDSRVAGILSGANGINPGIQLHQEGALEGGQNVALSGRVYALADASDASIKPGDLLTTSTTPGHCMKVTDHAKAQGAIIGKAMSALNSGKGMVLVLVSLQ
jgi:hypothetical protein